MEDPNLIATLIPVGENNYAENAFSRSENEGRCLRPIKGINDEPVISSREPTPARSLSPADNTKDDPKSKHQILLTFDRPPKDLTKGFAFGTDKEKCDVVLAHRGVRQTSGVHFHIKFDVIRGKRRLVLMDTSVNGSAVSYGGQAEHEVRRHFTWILDLEKRDRKGEIKGEWDVEVHVRGLEFKVKLANHEKSTADYNDEMDKFLEHSRTDNTPPVGSGNDSLLMGATRDLNVNSNLTSMAPSQPETPGRRRVYISEGNVGKGSFGKVDRVIDASTGAIYARKTFFDPEEDERERWLDHINREIRIMRKHPHENIIKLEDSWDKPPPFLVMPYLHLGSLRKENSRSPIVEGEAITLLIQGLSVLEHLHSRGVAYRDLKPDNILVESRSPFRVQFTDFGLANDRPDLQTFCGTEQYAAPEIFNGESYTTAIDIWSLGVIVLEYIYGLPTRHSYAYVGRKVAIKERGLAWCRRLIEYTDDWDSDRLMDLLVTAMLQMQPQERLSAGACLRKGYESGVFKSSTHSGHATPTQTRPPVGAVHHEEEAPTIVLDALWDVGQSLGSASLPETRSMLLGSKRHRSPASSSPSDISNESQVKRQAPESRLFKVVSGAEEDLTPTKIASFIWCGAAPDRVSVAPGSEKVKEASQIAHDDQQKEPIIIQEMEDHNVSSRTSILLPNIPLPEVQNQLSTRSLQFDWDGMVYIIIRGQAVTMRTIDCKLNATQICNAAGLTAASRRKYLKLLKDHCLVSLIAVKGPPQSWVPWKDGVFLCQALNLCDELEPLLSQALTGNVKKEENYLLRHQHELPNGYEFLRYKDGLLVIVPSKRMVNATQLLKANNIRRGKLIRFFSQHSQVSRLIVSGHAQTKGTYIKVEDCRSFCQYFDLNKDLVDILMEPEKESGDMDRSRTTDKQSGDNNVSATSDQGSKFTEPSYEFGSFPVPINQSFL